MKIELIQLINQISRQATLNQMTFRQAWLVFGAAIYTGWRELDSVRGVDVPPWTSKHDLPDLKKTPNKL